MADGPGTGPEVSLKTADERINAGFESGNEYVAIMERIRNDLDAADNAGTTLGAMVKASLEMTEAETIFNVRSGVPKKLSTMVQGISGEVKKGGG